MQTKTLSLLEEFKQLPLEEQTAFFQEVQSVLQASMSAILPTNPTSKGGKLSQLRHEISSPVQTEQEIDEWIKSIRSEWDRDF